MASIKIVIVTLRYLQKLKSAVLLDYQLKIGNFRHELLTGRLQINKQVN